MLSKEQRTALAAPFPAAAINWKTSNPTAKNTTTEVCAYIDARDVMDRLDEVLGVDGWSFDWQPVLMGTNKKNEPIIMSAKGTITIDGASKSDVGDMNNGNFQPNKAAVSDALKRAAVHFGIARYLYDLPEMRAQVDGSGKPTAKELTRLASIIASLVAGGRSSSIETAAPNEITFPAEKIRGALNRKGITTTEAQDKILLHLKLDTKATTYTAEDMERIKVSLALAA